MLMWTVNLSWLAAGGSVIRKTRLYVCCNPLVLMENSKWYVLSGGNVARDGAGARYNYRAAEKMVRAAQNASSDSNGLLHWCVEVK